VPNDDGIDIVGSRRVHISDMDIQTGDDCIALFTGEDITIANSTLRTKSAGVRVGYFQGTLRNVVATNLVIYDSNRGVNVNVRQGNHIQNVLFSNLVIQTRLFTGQWWGKAEPIHVSALLGKGRGDATGSIRELRFEHISAEGEAGILVYADPGVPVSGLEFSDVHVIVRRGPLQASYGGNFDLRGDLPLERSIFAHDIPAFFAHGVQGLSLRDFAVEWDDGLPEFFTHAVQIEDSRHVDILRPRGSAAHTGLDALRIEHCEDVSGGALQPH
jgi:hypothetical protein